jgi:hypothetical protein
MTQTENTSDALINKLTHCDHSEFIVGYDDGFWAEPFKSSIRPKKVVEPYASLSSVLEGGVDSLELSNGGFSPGQPIFPRLEKILKNAEFGKDIVFGYCFLGTVDKGVVVPCARHPKHKRLTDALESMITRILSAEKQPQIK